MSKHYIHARNLSFQSQNGRCYYCASPMWLADPESFANRYRLTLRQAWQFRCTGEHLVAQQDGGGHGRGNVVAACYFCNHARHAHRPKGAPTADSYRARVRQRVSVGKWLPCVLNPG